MPEAKPSIFITGAGAGIGAATARLFAARGWFVGLYDVNESAVLELSRELGPSVVTGRLDVTDPARFKAVLSEFFEAAGNRLDVLFNNAGIAATDAFEDIDLQRHHAVVDVNLKGVVNGCYYALPYLKQTTGSRVISMCSASAIYGAPSFAVYSGTKFAVRGLTEALNVEWARHGVTVMDVMPLFVDTPMVRSFENPPKSMERMGLRLVADDIANTVWKAANWPTRWWAWPRVHWLPGLQSKLLWLATKYLPVWLSRLTTRIITGY